MLMAEPCCSKHEELSKNLKVRKGGLPPLTLDQDLLPIGYERGQATPS